MRLTKSSLTLSVAALGLATLPAVSLFLAPANEPMDMVKAWSEAVQDVAAKVAPSVVRVNASFDPHNPQARRQVESEGSGVVVSTDGWIVTNSHVVGSARTVTVAFADGRKHEARVRGNDPETDLAVLKVDARDLKALPLRQGAAPRIGEWVLAVGNPLGFDQTVTCGIISASGRRGINVAVYEDFLQTDAAINPGNSGGPLIDLEGRVVGINTAMEISERGNQGLGFAIPAYMVQDVLEAIRTNGRVERGYLGVQPKPLDPDTSSQMGLRKREHVYLELPGDIGFSPARDSGIKNGDILLAIDGTRIRSVHQVFDLVAKIRPRTETELLVWRSGKELAFTVKVADRKDAERGEPSR